MWDGAVGRDLKTDTSQCESRRIDLWFSEELEEWRVVPKAPLQVPLVSTKTLDFCGEIKTGWPGSLCISSMGLGRVSIPVATGWRVRESSRDRGCDSDLGLFPHLL